MHCFFCQSFWKGSNVRRMKIYGNSREIDKEGVPEIQRPLFVVFIIRLISANHGANLLK